MSLKPYRVPESLLEIIISVVSRKTVIPSENHCTQQHQAQPWCKPPPATESPITRCPASCRYSPADVTTHPPGSCSGRNHPHIITHLSLTCRSPPHNTNHNFKATPPFASTHAHGHYPPAKTLSTHHQHTHPFSEMTPSHNICLNIHW
jgi:hypothetical protein